MKIIVVFILGLLLSSYKIHAPLTSYVTVNNTTARCQFLFPDNFGQFSDAQSVMYDAKNDNITFEMNSLNITNVESMPGQDFQGVFNSLPFDSKISAFGTMLERATGGQTVNQFSFYQDGQQGREMVINYVQEGDNWKLYAQFFYLNNTMYVFTVAGVLSSQASQNSNDPPTPTTNENSLLAAKNQVFSSIDFY